LPEGTGGFAESSATPDETDQAKLRRIAADRKKRREGGFMIGGMNTL
jgi:hypothetical protein